MRQKRRMGGVALLGAVVGLGLTGCSLQMRVPTVAQTTTAAATSAPASGSGPTAASAATETVGASAAPAVTDNEVPTPPGPDEHAAVTAGSAAAAVRAFAASYINWTAADLPRRLRRLAADSVGQARSMMTLAASQTASDGELDQEGVANHGTVEAVAPLTGGGAAGGGGGASVSGSAGSGSAGRYVVVTRESTTASRSAAYQGLAPAWHLTVATVARRAGGWVVSGWQPEN